MENDEKETTFMWLLIMKYTQSQFFLNQDEERRQWL